MASLVSLPVVEVGIPAALSPPLAILAGVAVDQLFGEARRWHPLVGFGRLATALERTLNTGRRRRARGLLAWSLLIAPALASTWAIMGNGPIAWLVEVGLLYLALGARSLGEHATRVAADLAAGDLDRARTHVGWIVSRQTESLDAGGVASACVESTLENGNDAIFGVLFWFLALGGTGAVLFRLANTLDAMWGYRNARFSEFGCVAARIDDALNYLPARLTAFSYAVCGSAVDALRCWWQQAPLWKSPNAGVVMAAGAGSLGVQLGGVAVYLGRIEQRPPLGTGRPASGDDIPRALRLVQRSLWLWLVLCLAWGAAGA